MLEILVMFSQFRSTQKHKWRENFKDRENEHKGQDAKPKIKRFGLMLHNAGSLVNYFAAIYNRISVLDAHCPGYMYAGGPTQAIIQHFDHGSVE